MKKFCLTGRELKTATAKDKDYVLLNVGGLEFRVRKNASKQWKSDSDYHEISLAETGIYR